MTTVANEGNKRVGDMSSDEMEQCIQDVKAWFQRSKTFSVGAASNADIQKLEKAIDVELPKILKIMLLETNGSLWFMGKQSMTTARIQSVVSKFEGTKRWRSGLIPFCGDEGMGMLVVDTLNGTSVHEWDEDDGVSNDSVAPSLASFLEGYRNQLLSGKCEFLGDAGVIERVAKQRK